MTGVDWTRVFIPDTPLLEIFVRGTIVYLGLFVLLRIVLKRQSGAMGVQDLLVVVLVADAAQNAMADDYHSVPDGLLLVATVVFWSYALDWLGFHWPVFQRLVTPPPLALVKNGTLIRRHMRRELITEDELMAQLRQQGVDSIEKVKVAYMEPDGRISVVCEDGKPANGAQRKKI